MEKPESIIVTIIGGITVFALPIALMFISEMFA